MSSRTPICSISRRIRTIGSSTSLSRSVSPRPRISSRCQAASAWASRASAADRIGEVGRQAALLAQLTERVGAARGLQQVGGDLGVVDEVARHLPQRLRVVGDHRVTVGRCHQLLGSLRRPGDHRLRPVDVRAEPPLLIVAEQRTLGGVRRLDGDRDLVARRAERAVELGGGRARAAWRSATSRPRGPGRPRRPSRAPPPAVAAARAARTRETPHAAASGRAGCEANSRDVETVERDLALGGREVLGDPGIVGVLGQVLLALGAGDLVDRVRARSRVTRTG